MWEMMKCVEGSGRCCGDLTFVGTECSVTADLSSSTGKSGLPSFPSLLGDCRLYIKLAGLRNRLYHPEIME